MNLRECILDSLVDGGENINSIENYMRYSKKYPYRKLILEEIKLLINQKLVFIEYPTSIIKYDEMNFDKIEDYYFALTTNGKKEWRKITDLD